MSKLRYGPRFGQGGVNSKFGHDEMLDREMRELAAVFSGLQQRPLYKRELSAHKAGVSNKKRCAKRADGPEREEAEMRMAEAVRKCVEILEFHMDDLVQHRKMPNRPHYVAQIQVHNVIYELRRKCGVTFADNNENHYTERLCEKTRRRDAREAREDVCNDREQQRLSRLRNVREMARRLAEKHNRGLT
jgi:hypothetical protein